VQSLAVKISGRTAYFTGHNAPSLVGRVVTVYYYVDGGHVTVAGTTKTTTGGQFRFGDRITEIAVVLVRDGRIQDVYETLVNPQRSIPPFITALTNITWDMVKDAPTFERVAPEVMKVLEGNVFVAHNATFDWRFLTAELNRATGRQLRGRRLCTVKMARKVLPQLPRRSLDHVARYYGVKIYNRHRAGGDAVATAKCLIRMVSDLADRGCGTWSELQSLLRTQPGRRKKRRRRSRRTPIFLNACVRRQTCWRQTRAARGSPPARK